MTDQIAGRRNATLVKLQDFSVYHSRTYSVLPVKSKTSKYRNDLIEICEYFRDPQAYIQVQMYFITYHYHLEQFHVLIFGPAFSRSAFSAPICCNRAHRRQRQRAEPCVE